MSPTTSLSGSSFSEQDQDLPRPGTEHLFRLFVGWVPKHYTESDLQPLFSTCGVVRDIIVLKDKVTGQPRGCAFVSYGTSEESEAAIKRIDRQIHLSGALCPLEVRFARSHQYIQAGAGPEDNRQLFFARAPVTATEEEILGIFQQFGPVEEVNLFKERRSNCSKGCGFVTMLTREQAIRAMESLDEKHIMEGSSNALAVKWADPDLQLKKRRAVEDSNADNRMLFFAKVLRSATEDEVKALFSKYGVVYDVNLFRAFQGAPTTKGCGLVTMATHDEAAAAIDALDSKHMWEGMDSPMVVKWMDAALQKRRREQHLAAMRQGLVPSMGMGPDTWLSALSNYPAARMQPTMLNQAEMDHNENPPAGCAPDAIKLFVGNIPKSYTEDQLKPFFETIGKVVELVIVRDKFSHESKGSAFVWYATRAQAERAILQFNLRHVLPDPTGEQDRPLVVRKAKPRQKVAHPAMAMLTGVEPGFLELPLSVQGGGRPGMGMAPSGLYGKVPPGGVSLDGMPLGDVQGPSGAGLNLVGGMGYRGQAGQMYDPGYDPRMAVLESVGDPGDPYLKLAGSASGGMQDSLALSMQLNTQQLGIVNSHLYSVQTMSGAQVHVTPGAPGLFYLVISGTKAQVESAKALVSTVIGQAI